MIDSVHSVTFPEPAGTGRAAGARAALGFRLTGRGELGDALEPGMPMLPWSDHDEPQVADDEDLPRYAVWGLVALVTVGLVGGTASLLLALR
jgi:hypothetical protein